MGLFDRVRGIFARQTQAYQPNRATRIVYVNATLAGVNVTPDTALQQAAVWACVQILSKSVAQLPWRLMRETKPGSSVAVPGPLDNLLNSRPNPEMSAFTFRQTLMGHALTWGNGFAEIERDGAGRPIALWPIEPDRVWIRRRFDTGRLYYQVNNQTKGITELDFMDVIHIHGPSFDGITGYNVTGYAAQSIGLAMAIERFGATAIGNNCVIGGFIKNGKTNLNAEGREAMLASLNEKHQGPDRAFKWEYLDGGMDVEMPTQVDLSKAQLVEATQTQVDVICRWFGVPPHKIAQLTRSTNNNIEHQGIEFVTDGVLPWTVTFEQEADYKLINPRNPQGYYTRIDVRSLQRGDLAARATFYQQMWDRGVFSVNDIREAEGMNEISDEEGGNKRFVPLNMQLLETAGAPEEPGEPPDTADGGDGGDPADGGASDAPGGSQSPAGPGAEA